MIKATLILLVAHLVIPRLRGRSAAERHALWAASLGAAAVLPVLVLLMPAWEPDWARRVADVLPAAFDVVQPASTSSGDIVIRATGVDASAPPLGSAATILWLVGTAIALLALLAQAVTLTRLRSSARVVTDNSHLQIARTVAESLGLSAPHLLHSARVAIPIAWGVRRARILLPETSQHWTPDRLSTVLAHEMAHVGRGDWIVHMLAELVCAVYWFHPLVWTARNRLGRESERAADDVVVGLGANRADYASHLVEIVRAAGRHADRLTPTVAMARGSDFERRVAALLSALVNRTRLTRGRAIAILTAAILVLLPLAAIGAGDRGMGIAIRTSNLSPVADVTARDGLTDGSDEAVRQIRVVDGADGNGSSAPEIVEYTTPPLYSDEARQRGLEGIVTARARIDATGYVTHAHVVSGLGFGLDQNALVALRQWRFRPGTRRGTAAPMEVDVDIAFTLRGETINAQIANDMVSLVGPGVTPPQAVKIAALRSGHVARGTVVLDVVLLEDGTPRILRILRSLGPDADEVAVRTFEQWRFSPAVQDGRPVKVHMNAEVTFHG